MGTRKKAKTKAIPRSAAQKGAEAALQASQRIALESQRARQASSSRGAVKARQLRSGGTSLQQYDLQRFKSDPFPSLGGGWGGPGAGPGARDGRPAAPRSPRPGGAGDRAAREKARSENRRRDDMQGPNNAERMQAQAEARARAAEARARAEAAAKKKRQQRLSDSKGGSVKAIGNKPAIS